MSASTIYDHGSRRAYGIAPDVYDNMRCDSDRDMYTYGAAPDVYADGSDCDGDTYGIVPGDLVTAVDLLVRLVRSLLKSQCLASWRDGVAESKSVPL